MYKSYGLKEADAIDGLGKAVVSYSYEWEVHGRLGKENKDSKD